MFIKKRKHYGQIFICFVQSVFCINQGTFTLLGIVERYAICYCLEIKGCFSYCSENRRSRCKQAEDIMMRHLITQEEII